jgi:predicted peptidase
MALDSSGFEESLDASAPNRWAAVVPIAHGWKPNEAAKLKDVAIWTFQSESDEMIAASFTREMVGAIQASGGKPLYTEFTWLSHAETAKQTFLEDDLVDWLLQQRRRDPK